MPTEISNKEIKEFQDKILKWYKENGRYFPWRKKSATNYELIIVEILLQRTKAETVSKFFNAFIKKYPSWKQLGNATAQELQNCLKPLGLYKQRGTGLYKLALEMNKLHGQFPKDRKEIEKLPTIGYYISNAIELFIFKKPRPLLDVNMARVLERYFGPRQKLDISSDPYLQELSKRVVNHTAIKKINWGMLDFGAKVCVSKNPKCSNCILSKSCLFYSKL